MLSSCQDQQQSLPLKECMEAMGYVSPGFWRRGLPGPGAETGTKAGQLVSRWRYLLLRAPEVLSDDDGVSVGSLLLLESAPRIWTRKHIPSLHSCLYFLLVKTNQKLGASDWENGTCKSLDSQNGAENNRWMIVQAYLLSGTLSASEHSRRSSIWLFEYLSFLFEKGNRSGAFYPGWIGSFAQGFCISTRWSQRPVLKG